MKAWLLDSMTGMDKLHLGEAAEPTPAEGEALLDVKLAALNPADRYTAEGQYPARPKLPHILGRDGVGIVRAIGAAVRDLKVGDKVAIVRSEVGVNRPGTLAERVCVPVESLVPIPHGWSDEQAAGASLVYITAWQALTQFADLPKNSVVLVTGASGGVGVATVQLARAMNHTVVAMSRDAAKGQKLLTMGAAILLDPNDNEWRKRLKAQLGERRVDLAVDNVGGSPFNGIIDVLGMNGRVSCVGRLAGVVPEFNTASLFFRRIQIRGVAIYTYTARESRDVWFKLLELLKPTDARPLVDSIWHFDKALDAFERMRQGPMGKVLVNVARA